MSDRPNWRRGAPSLPSPTFTPSNDGPYLSEECGRGNHIHCGDDGVCLCGCHDPDDTFFHSTYEKYFDELGNARSAW